MDSASPTHPATPESILAAWIEAHIGQVVRLERQGRWRPAWFVDARKDGKLLRLYVRGARADAVVQPQPLKFECDVFKMFYENGVKVPHIYGFIEALPAIVMSLEPGQPDLSKADPRQREAVSTQLVDQMILMHRSPPDPMEKAGAPRPSNAEALGLAYYRRIEPLYLATKCRPEPAIEFLRGWINRNNPEQPNIAYPITVDAGQFIFEGDALTAMLDFEFAALGDYHVDLAALRLRSFIEDVGDLNAMYRRYAERSGLTVDYHRLRYHTVVKGVLPPMHMAGPLGAGTAADYAQYMCWNVTWLRIAFESIAEINGWDLGASHPLPAPDTPKRFDIVGQLLDAELSQETFADDIAAYLSRRRLRLLRFQRNAARHGEELERRYVADAATLLGCDPKGWAEADAQLERRAIETDGRDDEPFVRLFWCQLKGQSLLLADPSEAGNYKALTTTLPPVGPGLA
jgi:aminoglycoside phosphotransferase (APT) family kinase protein